MSIKRDYSLTNLPKSFIESSNKLHQDGIKSCSLCTKYEELCCMEPAEIYNRIPWTKSKNIPPCVWSIGLELRCNWTDDFSKQTYLETITKYTHDAVHTIHHIDHPQQSVFDGQDADRFNRSQIRQ